MIQDEFYVFLAWTIFTVITYFAISMSRSKNNVVDTLLALFLVTGYGSMIYLLVRISINFY